jgi:cytoskeletal protein RodZ
MPVQQKASAPATNRRTAWVIVIIMSALVVLALLGTIWGFAHQARIFMAARAGTPPPSQTSGPQTSVSQTGAAATVTLAPGARIVSATTEAGKLVLHVATPTGGEVEIIDLATGKQTGQVKTAPP